MFSDGKLHLGQYYEGVRVGRGHDWRYEGGRWQEVKLAPDKWAIEYVSRKMRQADAPEGSGADVGSRYHWLVLAHQYVEKLDANTYATRLVGSKYKVGHKRPAWLRWSYEYGSTSVGELVRDLLIKESLDPNGVAHIVRRVA